MNRVIRTEVRLQAILPPLGGLGHWLAATQLGVSLHRFLNMVLNELPHRSRYLLIIEG